MRFPARDFRWARQPSAGARWATRQSCRASPPTCWPHTRPADPLGQRRWLCYTGCLDTRRCCVCLAQRWPLGRCADFHTLRGRRRSIHRCMRCWATRTAPPTARCASARCAGLTGRARGPACLWPTQRSVERASHSRGCGGCYWWTFLRTPLHCCNAWVAPCDLGGMARFQRSSAVWTCDSTAPCCRSPADSFLRSRPQTKCWWSGSRCAAYVWNRDSVVRVVVCGAVIVVSCVVLLWFVLGLTRRLLFCRADRRRSAGGAAPGAQPTCKKINRSQTHTYIHREQHPQMEVTLNPSRPQTKCSWGGSRCAAYVWNWDSVLRVVDCGVVLVVSCVVLLWCCSRVNQAASNLPSRPQTNCWWSGSRCELGFWGINPRYTILL